MGLRVKVGAKGQYVVKILEPDHKAQSKDDADEELAHENGRRLVMRIYTVFNATQVEGFAPLPARDSAVTSSEAVNTIVDGLKEDGMKVRFTDYQPACYPKTDEIRLPETGFFSEDDLHATLLHECAHATGHIRRMARFHIDKRSLDDYAREELLAELSSAMLCADIGLAPGKTMIANHAAYVSSWLKVLKGDKGEILRAAADAQRVCDYLSVLALNVESKRSPVPSQSKGAPGNLDFANARTRTVAIQMK